MGLMPDRAPSERLDVLVVDDSPTYRMILARTVKGCTFANLVGSAADGEAALVAIAEKHPHLVLLDVSMPVLDGIETLKRIRSKWADVDVVMCSGVDQSQTGLTMQALGLGALDFVPKPQGENPAESFAALGASLAPLLELALSRHHRRLSRTAHAHLPTPPLGPPAGFRSSLGKPATTASTESAPSPASAPAASPFRRERLEAPAATPRPSSMPPAIPPTGDPGRKPPGHIDLVAIGVSTGGPNALQALIPRIPANFPVPVLCVQHMPPLFTTSLAERLDRESAIHVQEGKDGMEIRPGNLYLAPGGLHMVVAKGSDGKARLRTNEAPPVNSCRPSVDVLFESVAAHGGGILSVILTGMGSDGAAGVKQLRAKGSWSIVQDEATSVVWGMPGTVASQGQADEILPLDRIASRMSEIVLRNGGRR
jgi:two-component system, chemotaxis family, protein-glutamate methylesterase/glutaminase